MSIETMPVEDTSTTTEIDTSVLDEIEERVLTSVTLADLIRRGAQKTEQAHGWGYGGEACAWSAAALEAKDLGYLK